MNYKIIENPPYTDWSRVGLELDYECDPLLFFMSSVTIEDFSNLLDCLINSVTYSNRFASFTIYEDLDWEDKEDITIDENEVLIEHHHFGNAVINTKFLKKLVFDYGNKLLLVYSGDEQLTGCFKNDILSRLNLLEKQL